MAEISIIIPLYNAERYLPRTLDSVTGQSFDDFEVIIIDDGSTDNSYEVCSSYAERFPYIKVFRQKNSGTSVSRRLAAEKAQGKYLCFLDADDVLAEDCLSTLYKVQIETAADMTVASYWRQNEQGEIVQTGCPFRKRYFGENADFVSVVGKQDIIELALKSWQVSGEPLFGALWARLIKRSMYLQIMEKIKKYSTICEDLYFYVNFLKIINKVVIIDKPVYKYTLHDTAVSLSSSFFNQTDHLYTFSIMKKYIVDLLVDSFKISEAEAAAQAYETISYQLIGNFVYNFRYYSKDNSRYFYDKTCELLQSEIVEKSVLHHKVLAGYSKLIPFLMRMKWARILIFVCRQRAKKRYAVK